ncbi:MBL fold metallo-hydrolase [Arthrobacter citreus]|nr:MBL fold metallo-hydrolase [Arthrobacter citreus]
MKKKILSIVLTSALLAGIAYQFKPTDTKAATKNLNVHFIDVGQGDAIYIKTPNGDDIVIDGGNKAKGDIVVDYLKKQKVKDIEVMISTHPDADHVGGLDEVLEAFKVKSVYAPNVSNNTQAFKQFLTAVKNEKLKIKPVTAGFKLDLKGVSAEFVGPVKSYSKSDLNDWSAVLKLVYNKNSFLFTGDAESKSEQDMIKSKKDLKVDVLKVGHHGAKTSSSQAFLDKVKPKFAVIGVGANNRYGHPTNDTLNRLKKYKTKVYRTDKNGSVVVTSDGKKITVKTEKK